MTSVNNIFESARRFFTYSLRDEFHNSVDYSFQCPERDPSFLNEMSTYITDNALASTTFALATLVTTRFIFRKKKPPLEKEGIEEQENLFKPLSKEEAKKGDELEERCKSVVSTLFGRNPDGQKHYNRLIRTVIELDNTNKLVYRLEKGQIKVETYNNWYLKLKGQSVREGVTRTDKRLFRTFTLALQNFVDHKNDFIRSQPEFKKFVLKSNNRKSCKTCLFRLTRSNKRSLLKY